jgi:hypothetical protein
VSGKNNKILPFPEITQGISTSAESEEERSKKTPAYLLPTYFIEWLVQVTLGLWSSWS